MKTFFALTLPGTKTQIEPPAGIPTIGGIITPAYIISLILQLLVIIAILISFIYLIWGGFDWIASAGEKQAVGRARQKLTFAIVGLVVVFLSFFIINALGAIFGLHLLSI